MTRRNALAAGTLLGALVLVALHAWRGIEYWNYSEGVYAYTSRLFLDGGDLYGHIVVAQPPWQFFFGAGALAIDDSLTFLRLAVGIAQLGAGVLAAVAVWRLTENPVVTALAPGAAPADAVDAARARRADARAAGAGRAAGRGAAGRVPAHGDGRGRAGRRRAVHQVALRAAADRDRAVLGCAEEGDHRRRDRDRRAGRRFTALFGFGLWDDSVIAQMYSGRRGLDILKGVWGQAFWSLLGLVALAAVAWWRRAEVRDSPLLKVLVALGVAMLATVLTNYKDGTGLNVLVPVEYALVPLALAGAVFVPNRWFGVAALVFVLAQSASLVVSPNTNTPFLYPTSERGAWGRAGSEADVEREVAKAGRARQASPTAARRSSPSSPERPMPDDQPDQFLPSRSSRLADVQRRMDAVQPKCA